LSGSDKPFIQGFDRKASESQLRPSVGNPFDLTFLLFSVFGSFWL